MEKLCDKLDYTKVSFSLLKTLILNFITDLSKVSFDDPNTP